MKKIALFLFIIIVVSCKSPGTSDYTSVYGIVPQGSEVYLNRLEISPPQLLNGVSAQIPDIVKCILADEGFIITEVSNPDTYILDIFIHSQKWQNEYTPVESVTLTLKLSRNGSTSAYMLHTENIEKSIDSFSWTFDLIQDSVIKFAAAVSNER